MAAHHSRKHKKDAGNAAQDSKVSETFFHKTKLCKFFPQGACLKGASCSFAHVQTELVIPPDLYRTRMCMAFVKAGKCKDGEHCKYAHSKAELRTGTVPCNLAAACEIPDDGTLSASAPVMPQEQPCFTAGFAPPNRAAPYICLPFDGSQMAGQMAGQMTGQMGSPMGNQLLGSLDCMSTRPMGSLVNRGMFFEDGVMPAGPVMKHGMASSSMTSTSGHTVTEDDLASLPESSRRSSSDYGVQEGRAPPSSSLEHYRSDTGNDEHQQEADAGDSRGERLFFSRVLKVKDQHQADRQDTEARDSAGSKFDVYLPQITEEQLNDQQNTEEERAPSYCSTEDYLDERQDILHDNMFMNFNRQLSCPAGFNVNDEEDEDAFLNDFQKQKWDRQCSAPAFLYKDTFLDIKVGNDPVFHHSTGYHVAIKNTFLDFGRPEEINRLRERRPSF